MSRESRRTDERWNEVRLSRRAFLTHPAILAGLAALTPAADVLIGRGILGPAQAAEPDPTLLVRDTLNGLVAFIVPGPDAYSVAQGMSTLDPGGMDANVTDTLIATLDNAQMPPPPFPSTSFMVATILNSVASAVHPDAPGPFPSPFARLSFPEKVGVFQYLESEPTMAPVAGVLLAITAFLCYSEAGVFDPATRRLTGTPIGWQISNYAGAPYGYDEFKGYWENRREVAD